MGISASRALSERVCFLEEYLKFLAFLQTQISYSAAPLPSLLEKYRDTRVLGPFVSTCLSGLNERHTFSQSWSEAIKESAKSFGLKKEEVHLICDFGSALGGSDVAGQISHCELNKQLVGTYLERAREEKTRKSKLYLMLGVCAGVAAALICC